MSKNKKSIRAAFRDGVLARDKYQCKMCGWELHIEKLDPHHITDRSLLPNQGMVISNGVTLCPDCHLKAEHFHSSGLSYPGYSPEDLYKKINSSFYIAEADSKRIK